MSLATHGFDLPIMPGSISPVLNLSQYDDARAFTAHLKDESGNPFTLPSGVSAKLEGMNYKGVTFEINATPSGSDITFTPKEAATDQPGLIAATLHIKNGNENISTLAVILNVQKAGATKEEQARSPGFTDAIQAAVEAWASQQGFTSPTVSIEEITGGHRITFTDAQHPQGQSIDVMDGEDTGVVTDDTLSIEGAAADAAAVGDSLGKLGVDVTVTGQQSESADISLNNKIYSEFGTDGFVSGEIFDYQTGQVLTSNGTRSPLFIVKPEAVISLGFNIGVVFFSYSKKFISSKRDNVSGRQEVTVPRNAYYAAVFSSTSRWKRTPDSSGFVVYVNFYGEAINVSSDSLKIKWENIKGKQTDSTLLIEGGFADSLAVHNALTKKANIHVEFNGSSTDNLNKKLGASGFVADEVFDASTGEPKALTGGRRTVLFPVKPGTTISVAAPSLHFYDYSQRFISTAKNYGFQGTKTDYIVPQNAYFAGASHNRGDVFNANPSSSPYGITSSYFVSDYWEVGDRLKIDWEDVTNKDIYGELSQGETARFLKCNTIRAVNEMRHAWRIASFNTYGTGGAGNRNWTAIKELLQECGIDMIGFQEVNNPNVEDSSGKTFEQALTSWHLSQFGIIQTAEVPTNCRPVATTGDFEIVSVTETKYSSQGNTDPKRHFAKAEIRLPRWKDKKASEQFKVSLYNTQLEVGTSTNANNVRLAQAAQLIAAMDADTNPFIILTGDFNEMSVGLDVVNAFKNAGYTPQLEDTSTPTAGRGFYDFIFVNERISFLENEVVPYDLHYYYPGGVQANISDHDLVFADVVFNYENLISVKTSLPNCTLSGGGYWLDRRKTEPVVYTVTPDAGYTVQSIATGQGDNDLTYNNGAVVLNGNTVTIKPNLVVGDVWINVTTAAS